MLSIPLDQIEIGSEAADFVRGRGCFDVFDPETGATLDLPLLRSNRVAYSTAPGMPARTVTPVRIAARLATPSDIEAATTKLNALFRPTSHLS